MPPRLLSLAVLLFASLASAAAAPAKKSVPATFRDLPLACIARIDYPPEDRRISYPQVYLLDLLGKRRIALTATKEPKASVRWVGREGLVWLGGTGVIGGGRGGVTLYYHDLRTRKTRRLAHREGIGVSSPPDTLPGAPVVSVGQMNYSIQQGRFIPSDASYRKRWYLDSNQVRSRDRRHPARVKIRSWPPGGVITSRGKSASFGFRDGGRFPVLLYDAQANRPWVKVDLHDSTIGNGSAYYEIDWKRRRAHLRMEGADVDFWPSRGLYAAAPRVTGGPLPERIEGAGPLLLGNWRTGWTRKLLLERGFVASISLRP